MYLFNKAQISQKMLTEIQSSSVCGFHQNNGQQIVQQNIDIWNTTNNYSNNIQNKQ